VPKYLLNIHTILKHLDLNNFGVYKVIKPNQEERKELDRALSYILPVWMAGCTSNTDQFHLMKRFNKHVNHSWWELEKHPELRAKVLAAIGPGRMVKHDLHLRPHPQQTALTGFLSNRYPDIRKDEVFLWCMTNSEAILIEMCKDYGVQGEDQEKLLGEYRSLVS
jgi:hypothetical protein